jgi:hypothetical protein
MSTELKVVKAAEVAERAADETAWLIESLWGAGAVGVIGGAPKCGKTWLALDMAVAVASGRPCLGRYAVPTPGPALVYAAEDAPPSVRERLEHLARARGADFASLDVGLIVEPSLRLDLAEDLGRLRATLARRRPRLLVLDPYVRLQRADENNATEVSAILSALRDLSRVHSCAIALVHHARKGTTDEPGQGLRGSSDFHAWGDSNLYVRRVRDGLLLAIEHRAAASPPPVGLTLVTGDPVRLEVRSLPEAPPEPPLAERLLRLLEEGPRSQNEVREALGVRTQTLGDVLREMLADGRVVRAADGRLARFPIPDSI